MDLYQNFVNLITSITAAEIILALYGLLLVATSFVKTMYGIYSFNGALALCVSIAVRMINGGNLPQAFIMVFIFLAVITVMFLLSVRFSKYVWILRIAASPLCAEPKNNNNQTNITKINNQ